MGSENAFPDWRERIGREGRGVRLVDLEIRPGCSGLRSRGVTEDCECIRPSSSPGQPD